jgi:hypothetical protein
MATPKLPHGTRHLRTYAEFETYLGDFIRGIYPFLWVFGRPGIAKSQSIRAAACDHHVYIATGGQLTSVRLYVECYHHRGEPIVLDDAEHILDDKIGRRILAALGDTNPVKRLSYGTAVSERILGDVPDSFQTTSPLLILANEATTHQAIQSRAVIIYFDPTSLEIHRAAARWFWDQEIHDWVGQHLYGLHPIDARWYVHAAQDKRARRDWRRIFLTHYTQDLATTTIQDLEEDAAYPTREEKAQRYVELLAGEQGASRATYFRRREKLEAEGQLAAKAVAPIRLAHTQPPEGSSVVGIDSPGATPPAQPEEEPRPVDVPAREEFTQPIRGETPRPAAPHRTVLDDRLPWEGPPSQDKKADE